MKMGYGAVVRDEDGTVIATMSKRDKFYLNEATTNALALLPATTNALALLWEARVVTELEL